MFLLLVAVVVASSKGKTGGFLSVCSEMIAVSSSGSTFLSDKVFSQYCIDSRNLLWRMLKQKPLKYECANNNIASVAGKKTDAKSC